MNECPDLCTAEKCAQLEEEIHQLRDLVRILQITLNNHLDRNIPDAHKYDSNLQIEGYYENKGINLSISDVTSNSSTSISLPFVTEDDFDEHSNKKIPDAHDYQPKVNVDLFFDDGRLQVTVSVDDESSSKQVFIMADCDLNSLLDKLELVLSIVNSFSAELNNIDNSIGDVNNNITNISNNVSNVSNSVSTINSNVSNINSSVSNIDNTVNTISNSVTNIENNTIVQSLVDLTPVLNLLEEVLSALNTEFTGTVELGFCELITTDDNGNSIAPIQRYSATNADGNPNELTYTGNGLTGLKNQLIAIEQKLTEINKNACNFQFDYGSIDLKDLFDFCSSTPLLEQSNFSNLEAYADYLKGLIPDNLAYLRDYIEPVTIPASNGNQEQTIVSTTFSGTPAKLFQILGNIERNNSQIICNEIKKLEDPDVVAIVSSDKTINNAKEKQLILHFVSFDNYPKRTRNSSYRPVQIPEPKANLDWNDDFEDLIWVQGTLYCELFFIDYKTPVSGYFADKDLADTYFNLPQLASERRLKMGISVALSRSK